MPTCSQSAPPSRDTKIPPSVVPIYNTSRCAGSLASARTSPPAGPIACHTCACTGAAPAHAHTHAHSTMDLNRKDLISEVISDTGRVRSAKNLRRNERKASVVNRLPIEAPGHSGSGGAQQHAASCMQLLQSKTLLAEIPPPAIAAGRPAASFLPQQLQQTCNGPAMNPKSIRN